MNNAPLYDALASKAREPVLRFHMPGHMGKTPFSGFSDPFSLDFTETYGTGNLYQNNEPILSAEQEAAAYFGAKECFFMTNGSTGGILAALAAAFGTGGEIIVDRCCHQALCTGLALLDIQPRFVYPAMHQTVRGRLCPEEIDAALAAAPHAKGVFLTSPNYYGVLQDVAAIARICRRYGKLLVVDEAHGAHFPAVGVPNAMQQGADLAVVSAHKTMPALGQSAFLLSNGRIPAGTILRYLAMFQTSSPSYVLLASLDRARAFLCGEGGQTYRCTADAVPQLRERIVQHTPFTPLLPSETLPLDPCRLTVSAADTNLTGYALADTLYHAHGIACEMADALHTVFIITCMHTPSELHRLFSALSAIHPAPAPLPLCPLPAAKELGSTFFTTIRQALFSPSVSIPYTAACGRICARPVVPYPPGVPLLYPGEKFLTKHIEYIRNFCYNLAGEVQVLPE